MTETTVPGTNLVVVSTRSGGPLRPTAAQVRARALQSFADRMHIAETMADGSLVSDRLTKDGEVVQVGPEHRDQLKALDLLGKYAGLAQSDLGSAPITVNVFGGIGLGASNLEPSAPPRPELDPVGAADVGAAIVVPRAFVEGLGQVE